MAVFRWDGFGPPPAEVQHCVLTIGNFDGVHRGHLQLVREAMRLAGAQQTRAVALTFDPHPLTLLRPGETVPTLTTTEDRCAYLHQAGLTHVLVLETSHRLLNLSAEEFFHDLLQTQLAVRGIVEGLSFRFGHDRQGTPEVLTELCRVAELPLRLVPPVEAGGQAISSSRVRKALADGNTADAELCLGRRYAVRGRVVRGQARGRTLGFPTANLAEMRTLLPAAGVYAGLTEVDDKLYAAAINIGGNPTFDVHQIKLEVHLLEFSGDLYDRELCVEFLAPLRGVQRFVNAEALRQQLAADVAKTAELFQLAGLAAPPSVSARIEAVLDATVRPLLREDGSDVELAGLDADGVARLRLLGSCRSCPATVMTLLTGIERELMKQVPEVAYLQITTD